MNTPTLNELIGYYQELYYQFTLWLYPDEILAIYANIINQLEGLKS